VKLWKTDGTFLKTLTGHVDKVWEARFSPDGKVIATASSDNTIKLWRRDGTLIRTLNAQGHEDWVWGVAFSPDKKMLASAGKDDVVKLWTLDGQLLTTLTAHSDWVRSVAFSHDSKKLASASADKLVILRRVDSIEKLYGDKGKFTFDSLLKQGCDELYDYLKTNPNVKLDRNLCD
jgi:WD40 repeat protein